MIKKLTLTVASKAIALTFVVPQILYSMEKENPPNEPLVQKAQARTIKGVNAYKMWLFNEGLVQAEKKERLPFLHQDARWGIGGILYELTKNPVLEGELIYKRPSDEQQFIFKIKELLKEGTLDLSSSIFQDVTSSLVITTNPIRFLQIKEENEDKLVIMVTSWLLIEEKSNSTAAPFSGIMATWNENVAPIGIFWRWGNCEDLNMIDHLTNHSIHQITSKSLYDLWRSSKRSNTYGELSFDYIKTSHLQKYYIYIPSLSQDRRESQ